jgi:sulfite exporter TauE/SafE
MTFVWTAFLIGLLGSMHCVGMCGPIALALPLGRFGGTARIVGNLLYQFGRVITYALLGSVIGLLVEGLSLAGFQQYLSIVAGVLMLVMAFWPGFERNLEKWTSETSFMQVIRKNIRSAFQRKSFWNLLLIGILNGLLPCGLVYAGLFGALAMNTRMESTLFMVMFGLGTIPAMATIAFLGGSIGQKWRRKFRRTVPIVLGILGILFILRGAGLGIPYLSPPDQALIIQEEAGEHCH